MNRKEHLQWCKDRALEYVNRGDVTGAFTSMMSDLSKHPETKDHIAIQLGYAMFMGGELVDNESMEKFIMDFN